MQSRRRKKDKYDVIKHIGYFLIILSILIVVIYNVYLYYLNVKELDKINKFYDIQENIVIDNTVDTPIEEETTSRDNTVALDDYIALLEIPKIDLKKGLFNTHYI